MAMTDSPACEICGGKMHAMSWGSTLVGYFSPPGHDHDDNCLRIIFRCENGHECGISPRRKCPVEGCDWEGKAECWCHKGPKAGIWTNESPARFR